jgi:hypothetical protein
LFITRCLALKLVFILVREILIILSNPEEAIHEISIKCDLLVAANDRCLPLYIFALLQLQSAMNSFSERLHHKQRQTNADVPRQKNMHVKSGLC